MERSKTFHILAASALALFLQACGPVSYIAPTGASSSSSKNTDGTDPLPASLSYQGNQFNLLSGQSTMLGTSKFTFTSDGNLVLYNSGGTALWNLGTFSNCSGGSCNLIFQPDGNLVMYNAGTPFWNSSTSGHSDSTLFVSATAPYLKIIGPLQEFLYQSNASSQSNLAPSNAFSILSPVNGAVVSGLMTIQGLANSQWVNVAASNPAGTKLGTDTAPSMGSYSLPIDTTTLPDGPLTLSLTAYSVSAGQPGGTWTTVQVSVTIHNLRP